MKVETKPGSSAESGMGASFRNPLAWTAFLLAIVLCLFFWKSFTPNYVLFGNDDPLGIMAAQENAMPDTISGAWNNLNWLGNESLSPTPGITTAFRLLVSPKVFTKFYYPLAIFLVGISACFCFRQFKLSPLACILGGLAAACNSDFLSTACWGVASQVIGIGATYVALGLLAGAVGRRQWLKVILAGLLVGINIMEAYDIGAIFSLFVAAFALYQALFLINEGEPAPKKFGRGVLRIAIVAGFAAFISIHSLHLLVGTQVQGIAGSAQDELTKQQRWEEKTQWSVPKDEILQVVVPGIFGYRNIWHMYEGDQPREDQYWGTIGAGGGLWRLIGTGFYAGVLVVMVTLWAMLQSFRKQGSPFSKLQRRAIWFWSGVLVAAALLAFGKNAPFYQFFYALPYASTIRNPAKFMHVFSWALVILFAYGMHGLFLAYMQNPVARANGVLAQYKAWFSRAVSFEKKWMVGCFIAIGVALLGWVVYSSDLSSLESYIKTVGIDPEMAPAIAKFSVHTVGWFILFLLATVALLALIFSGQFAGSRAKWGAVLLGALLIIDLGRADLPWILYWNVDYKYASNPIINFLAEKPYEQRVSFLPFQIPGPQYALLQNSYGSHWKQQLFPYYNIQCAEIVQEPRIAMDKEKFMKVMPPNSLPNLLRFWEITNARYILGPGGEIYNQVMKQLGPYAQQFRILKSFNFVPKGSALSTWPVDYTAVETNNGELAVIEFTGALPRASLFSNWQPRVSDDTVLKTLPAPDFDPHRLVLVADDIPAPLPANTNQLPGTVAIEPNYKPKRMELDADVKVPSVLLLSERFSPNWFARVDGKPAKILRCNFIMRGLYLEPGKHDIVFTYRIPLLTFYISLAGVVIALGLSAFLLFDKAPVDPAPASKDKSKKGEPSVRAAGK